MSRHLLVVQSYLDVLGFAADRTSLDSRWIDSRLRQIDANDMSEVVDIRQADDARDVIHRAIERLAEGDIVALPTEAGYVLAAHALKPQAVQRLAQLDSTAAPLGRQLVLKSAAELRDYVPDLSRVGLKLTRRCWPGPVAFVLRIDERQGLLASLPDETREAITAAGRAGFRVPAETIVGEILRLSPAPLVLLTDHSLNAKPGMAREAKDVAELYGERVALTIDGGPCQYDRPATVVEVEGEQWRCAVPGVVSETMLGRLASEVFLFVCTGNTCRSPMAEGWFRKLLAERLQCAVSDLVDRGYLVLSAGLSAAFGAQASPETIELARESSIELESHESQPLTDRMLDQADSIFTMTRGHRDSILSLRPDLDDKVALLSPDGNDVPDPMGFGLDEYRVCERTIHGYVKEIVDRLPLPAA